MSRVVFGANIHLFNSMHYVTHSAQNIPEFLLYVLIKIEVLDRQIYSFSSMYLS